MRLSEALESFSLSLQGVKSCNTVRWYRYKLGPLVEFLGDPDLASVTVHHLRAWRADLVGRAAKYEGHPLRPDEAGGLSSWTVHGHVRAARRFFRWLVDEGELMQNPAQRLELPRLPDEPRKGIGQRDMERMLAAARSSPRDYALLLFLADTACRVGGVTGLRLADLELESGRAVVTEKGSKTRTVFLRSRAVAAMRAWLTARPRTNSDRVFTGSRGSLTETGVYQVLKRLATAAGVTERWNPHQWRHGAARGMLARGANLAQVSQILGHSDVSVTARFYGSFVDEELQAAHAQYSWLADEDVSTGD